MEEILARYCAMHRTDAEGRVYATRTQLIRIDADVHRKAAALLLPVLPPGRWPVFADANTRRVAADEVLTSLADAGLDAPLVELLPDADGTITCDDATIAVVRAHLERLNASAAVAVGAGTINDLVKMAAFQLGLPYACVATAPSMNGYTSAIAAILSQGVKTTQPCHAPLVVLAHPDVQAQAPYRMIASGIGDLYSKPVSNADWRLSHRLLGSMHSSIVMEVVEAGNDLLAGVAPRLPARDPEAVARLTAALMLSGLAMQAAGSSMSASGGEHLISHYIDMTSVAHGDTHDFHGCQVAVGTLVTSRLYETVRAIDPTTIDIEGCVARWPDWQAHEAAMRTNFDILADAVVGHAKQGWPTPETLRLRLRLLVDNWEDIMADAGKTLRPSVELEAELRAADCPTRFDEISVAPERAWRAIAWSKDIRARYTILHLAAELGVLESFASAETGVTIAPVGPPIPVA